MNLALDDFPFRTDPIDATDDWNLSAARHLLSAAGLPDSWVPSFDVRSRNPITTPKMRLGMFVGSIRTRKEATSWTVIQLSVAVFSADGGTLLAWTPDLDTDPGMSSSPPASFTVSDRSNRVWRDVLLDPETTARIRSLAARKKGQLTRPRVKGPFGHARDVCCLAFTADEAHLLSIDLNGRLTVWDATTGAAGASVVVGRRMADCLAISPDSRLVAAGPVRPTLFEIPTAKRVLQIAGHPKGDVKDLCFSPSGALLATASGRVLHESGADHSVAVWDARSGKAIVRWEMPEYREVRVAFSPDETRLHALGLYTWGTPIGGVMRTFDLTTRSAKPVAELVSDHFVCPSQPALVATPTEVLAVLGYYVLVLDASTLTEKRRIELPELGGPSIVYASMPSSDGRRVAVVASDPGFDDGVVIVSLDGAPPRKLTVPDGLTEWRERGRSRVAWSPAGTKIAGTSGPRLVAWDVESGDPLAGG
jgi:WD40 repeat protein